MNLDQLRLRYIGTVGRHWRSSLDQSGPTPALLDDLCAIADEHAQDIVKAAVLLQAQPPTLVAAVDAVPGETPIRDPSETPSEAPVPGRSPTARTGTRQRRSESA